MTASNGNQMRKVAPGERDIAVELETGSRTLPLEPLPEKCIAWIEQGRRGMYDQLLNKETPEFFSAHLPVVITQAQNGAFPFNCSNKGIGFIPREERLSEFIDLFQETLHNTRGKPWRESMAARIAAMSKFYFDREVVDYRSMSGLEIFAKQTYQNLAQTPLAALHFTGCAPEYMSFQLNCAVEVIAEDDPRHTFVLLARTMFEYDDFHIVQPQYPYAYIFWVSEVVDKTPRQVQTASEVPVHGGMRWSPEAAQAVERAPGMIQQFIREQIEQYAADKGVAEISLDLVQEAHRVLRGGAEPKAEAAEQRPVIGRYGKVFAAVDGSELSNSAMDLAVRIGKGYGAELYGCHVYAAKLHDQRFRAMEGGLPEQFQEERELEKQRDVHDSLITQGLELITDSYLEQMSGLCQSEELPFSGISLEGRNWQALVADIDAHDYDLVALGAFGVGRVSRSLLGTVAERVLRRVRRDVLLCKRAEEDNASAKIVVCLDGSTRSWGALMRGIQLARAFDKELVAVSAFDPYFHYTMFNCLNEVLTDKAREVFKFEEQEKLHEDIIDSGLAKIYQSHLKIAEKIADDEGVELETHLLDGKAFDKILEFAQKTSPWLLVVGRIGIHSDEEMDIGGNTENLCRLARCNVLVVDTQFKPSVEYQAEETVTWTKEARAKMEVVPPMAQGVAMRAVQNYCLAEGYTIVTGSVLNAAIRDILPPEAIKRMGISFDEEGEDRASHDRIALSFKCPACGHVHRGARPQVCPICGQEGREFKLAESKKIEDGVVIETLGERQLVWEQACLAELEEIADEVLRRQIRTQLEKRALTQRVSTITLEMFRECAGLEPVEPVWTDEATTRLERVPEGFMRRAAQDTVEEYARENGCAEITLEVAEGGLGKAREKMATAMRGGKTEAHAQRGEEVGKSPARRGSFECDMCGLVVDGAMPERCPSCQADQFRALTDEERRAVSRAATIVFEWDDDALETIGCIPPGFMRTMTRCRIEQWARKHGYDRISPEVVEEKYASWGKGSEGLERELTWSVEAMKRVGKIPDFIRPMVMREIERSVQESGGEHVDGEVIGRFLETMFDIEKFHQTG